MAKKRVRVLVANAAGARMLRADAETRKLELLRSYPHLAGRAKAGDLVTDRPGRSFELEPCRWPPRHGAGYGLEASGAPSVRA